MRRRVVVLAGGTGSVKLVRGLSKLDRFDLSVISNVGDNIWLYGLYVCPDIDTVLYGLSSLLDKKRGWGVAGDTFNWLDTIKRLGLPSWFQLGDRDLATHIARTELLRRGMSLSRVTDEIRKRLAIKPRIFPASDQHVPTMIDTPRGRMHLQEFWVRYKAKMPVKSIVFEGAQSAKAARPALQAILRADKIIIAPGNPVTSIGPIISLPEIRSALMKRKADVTAVSPLIGNRAFSGPALKYLKSMGVDPSPVGVAKYYSALSSSIIIAKSDSRFADQIRRHSLEPILANIVMDNVAQERDLAVEVTKVREALVNA